MTIAYNGLAVGHVGYSVCQLWGRSQLSAFSKEYDIHIHHTLSDLQRTLM